MPYEITTKDGITIRNIPDDVPPDAPQLKERVLKLRLERGGTPAQSTEQTAAERFADPNSQGPSGLAAQIPGIVGGDTSIQADPQFDASKANIAEIAAEVTKRLSQTLLGSSEATIATGTGLTGGAVGMAAGTGGGLAAAILDGSFGTKEAAQLIEQAAMAGAQQMTYAPRTQEGQQQTAAVGEAMQQLIPAIPVAAELGAVASSLPAVVEAGRVAAGAARPAIQSAAQRVASMLPGATETPAKPTAGTMGSVGSAGTDMATQRRMLAEDLPVPIKLTEGQATRDFAQTQFEREAAKNPTLGQPLRERFEDQNSKILKNFDSWIDQTGAQSPNLRDTGTVVTTAIKAKADSAKAAIKDAYKKADKSEEAQAAVDPNFKVSIASDEELANTSLINYLNEKPSGLKSTGLTDDAKKYAIQLGIATKNAEGLLEGLQTTVKKMEALRTEINNATTYDAPDIRNATILKKIIDAQTEAVSGPLYKKARTLRARYADEFENRAVIADLLNNKRGMDDRKVALEDVHKRAILDGSLDDVRMVRKTLQTQGDAGKQAWRELQGATVAHIKEQASKNVGTDAAGNRTVSAAGLDRAINALDKDGKLDFVFGKKGAQQMRDINDLAKVALTVPANSVNNSNTASILLAALDMGVSSAAGLPLPITSGLKMIVGKVKDRKLAARIRESLK